MAASGFTPISLYYSTTAAAVPTSGNLVAGELALNTVDEKLYFKNSAGTVKLLASNAGSTATVSSVAMSVPSFLSVAGSPITSSGTLAVTLSGTALPVLNGGTGQTSYTDGQLLIGNTTGNTLTKTTLTAGSNITITNGSGAITIAASSGASAATPTTLGTVYGLTSGNVSPYNAFIGYNAGTLTTGANNVVVGMNALSANTIGFDNVAIGQAALASATTADTNTVVGRLAAFNFTTGSNNTVFGKGAMQGNTAFTGNSNIAVGEQALFAATTAVGNTAVGYQAQSSTTTATYLTAIGYQALKAKTTADNVVAVGAYAGNAGTTGSFGTYVGAESGFNVTGVYNTAIGYRSINGAACTGGYNTAVGNSSLYSITSGQYNVAIGTEAGYSTTVGTQSVYIGAFAGAGDPAAGQNTYIGYSAGKDQTSDGFNTYIGRFAGSISTAGAYGVALGDSAGKSCNRSVYIGYLAGYQCTGYANAFFGYTEQTNATTATGCVSLGSCRDTGSYAPAFNLTSETNRISMGSTYTTNAYIQVAWTVVSDARDKMNFAPVPHGLDFVNQLNPVAFQFKEARDIEVPNGPVRYGFKAQEILALEGDAAVIIDNEHSDKLRYNGEALVPVLVKALQELNAKFEAYVLAHP